MSESDFEANLYQQRRDTRDRIVALGQQAYPNSYAFTHTIPELRAFDTPENTLEALTAQHIEASIAGRIMAIRVQGKAGFAQLQGGGERLQIYVRKDDVGEQAFALYKLLDLGDHIGVRGFLMRTRTGELTLHAHEVGGQPPLGGPALTFLAKAMLALPDKYHGLEDTELRYRQRYVDLFMNTGHTPKTAQPAPDRVITLKKPSLKDSQTLHGTQSFDIAASAAEPTAEVGDLTGATEDEVEPEILNVRETFVKRAAILRAIRRFFDERGFLEVETPMLHTIAGGAAARPFKTHHNALDIPLSLRIAPELFLKRLVVGGLDRVYEINRNFRNEGVSTRHNPEFTMLEFYQAYANYHDLMDLTQELISFVAMEVNGTTICSFNGTKLDLSFWKKYTMREAIAEFWDSRFGTPPSTTVLSSASTLRDFLLSAHAASVRWQWDTYGHGKVDMHSEFVYRGGELLAWNAYLKDGGELGKIVQNLFELLAEPHLIQPTIIYDFPLAVSPLSKQKPDDPDWVERFEFYIGGFEVGNAFSELNDPDEQRKRFEAQLAERDRGDDEAHQMDEDYVRALGYGLPPTAGEGIGIDRLTMILTGAKSIRDVILFPLMRPRANP